MWIVAKYKLNEHEILKHRFKEVLGNHPEYYAPKVRYTKIVQKKFKIFKKSILENYIICFHNKFTDKNIINVLKNTRGIINILDGFKNNQEEIKKFIERCRNFQDKEGFINQDFFSENNFTKGQFVSGPFTNLFFEVLSKYSDRTEILIGKYKTTILKKKDFLYRPI